MIGALAALAGLAAKRKPGLREGTDIPRIEAKRDAVAVDAEWLGRYRRLTSNVDDGFLAPLVPQLLASALHIEILANPLFPLPAMGIVHVGSRIEERKKIAADALLDITAFVEGQTRSERGIEIDIVTEVRMQGSIAWRSVTTILSRHQNRSAKTASKESAPKKSPPKKERTADDLGTPASSSVVIAAADLGRAYARVSDDANPIHLYAITAKAFGFKRAIAHGAWTLARALAEVNDALPQGPRVIEARFIRPVFLPSRFYVERFDNDARGAQGVRVAPTRGGAPHVMITISKQ